LHDQPFQFAERLLLENVRYLFPPATVALAQNQLARVFEECSEWRRRLFLQLFLTLKIRQSRQLAGRQFEEFADPLVEIRAA
jgi:hypothetical protein